MGGLEPGDYGFVEGFACGIKDFSEAGLGRCEGMAEFEEGFGDGAGGGAGETDDANSASAGWGGDGYDGVFEAGVEICFAHFGFFHVSGRKKY